MNKPDSPVAQSARASADPERAAARLILERAARRAGFSPGQTMLERVLLIGMAEIGVYGEQSVRVMRVAEQAGLLERSQVGELVFVALAA